MQPTLILVRNMATRSGMPKTAKGQANFFRKIPTLKPNQINRVARKVALWEPKSQQELQYAVEVVNLLGAYGADLQSAAELALNQTVAASMFDRSNPLYKAP